jgi:hypothetical protein
MAAIQRYTYSASEVVVGGQDVVNLDYIKIPFQASVLVDLVSGSVDYAIEFTTDDISGDPATFRWNTVPNLAAGQTTTQVYKLDFPVTAIRLNIQSMTGEARISVIQGLGTTII